MDKTTKLLVTNDSSNGQISGPKKLTVVKPRKTIFVSRLARDTTADDLLFYVKSKLTDDLDILCFKIKDKAT